MIFWDASALVRCYVPDEPGSERARHWLVHERDHQGSALLLPEISSAVVRRIGADRRLAAKQLEMLDEHLARFNLLPVGEPQIERAVALIRRRSLTAADAIHVATAVLHARDLGRTAFRFATCDGPQAAAARAEGLRVVEPA